MDADNDCQPNKERMMHSHLEEADRIVKKYMNWSFVGGLIPIPLADLATVSGIQAKMLYDLSELYGVEFKKEAAQSAVAALLGSVVPGVLTSTAFGAGLKFIPVIGTTLGVLTMPALSLGATYAIGRVFTAHFETGGTLLDFDPAKMREHFRAEFEAGKKA
jgi:uncharacterized protein (DUF697 family)